MMIKMIIIIAIHWHLVVVVEGGNETRNVRKMGTPRRQFEVVIEDA